MYRRSVTLANDTGLHVRPATIFMQAASRYQSTIRVRKEGHTADGKSAISLMLLEAGRGSELIVEAEGSDETEAVDALVGLVESRFGDATTLA
jgi:phosphotransferase system HPr (HPr) family protein